MQDTKFEDMTVGSGVAMMIPSHFVFFLTPFISELRGENGISGHSTGFLRANSKTPTLTVNFRFLSGQKKTSRFHSIELEHFNSNCFRHGS